MEIADKDLTAWIITNLNRTFGGNAVLMRDTLIQQVEGFLGQLP